MLKLLVDENLTPALVAVANARGFVCSHVSYLGRAGEKDWELKKTIFGEDWTLITANSVDFRGPAERPGASGEYADVQLHAGLICINAPGGTNRDVQQQLMELILDNIEEFGDLVNQVLEVDVDRKGNVILRRYELPPDNE